MNKYSSCPGCGYKPDQSSIEKYIPIYKCVTCGFEGKLYCDKCIWNNQYCPCCDALRKTLFQSIIGYAYK
jgi:hypothetical protein